MLAMALSLVAIATRTEWAVYLLFVAWWVLFLVWYKKRYR
jgi:hypothetical protein